MKTKEKQMKTKETYKIVLLLATESVESKLLLNYDKLYYDDGHLDLDGEVFSQHLYVVCDKFKEGDNIVCVENGEISKRMNINKKGRTGTCVFTNSNDGSIWVKIIATTDKSLNLPLIPESFIPIYIKAHNNSQHKAGTFQGFLNNPITEVDLEYEDVVANNPNIEYDYQGIKINPNNEVIIIQPNIHKEYSTDEVIELLKKFDYQFTNNTNSDNWYKNWISENL